jgi:hypothetical protein
VIRFPERFHASVTSGAPGIEPLLEEPCYRERSRALQQPHGNGHRPLTYSFAALMSVFSGRGSR